MERYQALDRAARRGRARARQVQGAGASPSQGQVPGHGADHARQHRGYALLFPVWFAVGIVVLIWVHEMGHVLQLRREGIPASAPMFIPFLGAFVAMKRMPKDALAEARVGLAGPVLGTLGASLRSGFTPPRGSLFLGLAYFNFIINLFNLAPLLPLDGGRAVGAMSPVFQLLGLVVMVALFFVAPIMALIALLGLPELWHRWKIRNTPEGKAYYDLPLRQRVAVGVVYLGLIAVLTLDGGYVRA